MFLAAAVRGIALLLRCTKRQLKAASEDICFTRNLPPPLMNTPKAISERTEQAIILFSYTTNIKGDSMLSKVGGNVFNISLV